MHQGKVLKEKLDIQDIPNKGREVKMVKPKGGKFITVNLKDICYITNNPGPAKAPITDEMFKRVLGELNRKKTT